MAEKPEKFVKVEKEGQTIQVHPGQVEQHQRLGWKISEDLDGGEGPDANKTPGDGEEPSPPEKPTYPKKHSGR
jgi:hypothetical protein